MLFRSRTQICKKLRILGWGCDQLNSLPVSLAFRSGGDRCAFLRAVQPIHFGRGIINCLRGCANLSPFAYASVIEAPGELGWLCSTNLAGISTALGAGVSNIDALSVERCDECESTPKALWLLSISPSVQPLVRLRIWRHRQIAREDQNCWRRPPRQSTGLGPMTRSAGSRSVLRRLCVRAIAPMHR